MPTEPQPHCPCSSDQSPAAILERLIRERRFQLLRLAASVAGQRFAEDALQAACLGFLRSYDPATAYGGPAGAYRYLATATAHSAGKLLRGERRQRAALPPAGWRDPESNPLDQAVGEGLDPAEVVGERDELARAQDLLDVLPDEQRAILVARAAGFTPREIQEASGLSGRQYRKRIEKANRRLGSRAA